MRIMDLVVLFSRLWGQEEVMVADTLNTEDQIRYLQTVSPSDCYDLLYKWANEFLSSANTITDPKIFFRNKLKGSIPVL